LKDENDLEIEDTEVTTLFNGIDTSGDGFIDQTEYEYALKL
jgi:Ca2+-binding EF-hand superfamily protein